MSDFLHLALSDLLSPRTVLGALVLGGIFLVTAVGLAAFVRRGARRLEMHLSDVTGLAFASGLGQVMVYLIALILYAHLIPDLRSVGTALLAGASVVSVVFGLAAQSTLSNVVAGFSLLLYRPFRVGDQVQVNTPKGMVTAVVEVISLGYTNLRDGEDDHVLVPNSVMMGTTIIRLKDKSRETPVAISSATPLAATQNSPP
jgi:small-conductance mechanosensitive channel